MDVGKLPGLAAVVGCGEVGAGLVGMCIIAARDCSVKRVAEGDRKTALRGRTVSDGSIGHRPGFATVGGVKDTRCRAASGEPDVGSHGCYTGVAGGERTLAVESWRKLLRVDVLPASSAIAGAEDLEFSVHGIAYDEAMPGIRESHAVEEALGLMVGELEFPVVTLALVIDAGLVAGAGSEEKYLVGKGLDAAKVEIFAAGDVIDGPGFPAILCDEICTVGTARPDFVVIDDADAAQRIGAVALLRLPLGEGGDGEQEDEH